MSVTIKDIAASLGVSDVTVSRALRGSGRMAVDTRQRVLHIAREMGYRPNSMAQAIRRGRSGNIGLMLSSSAGSSYLPHQLLTGIDQALSAQDLQLIVGRLPDEKLTREGFVPKLLRQWSADGLLINYQEQVPERMRQLMAQEHVPSVWINFKQPQSAVYVDDEQAGRVCAEALLKAGHTRIAFLDYSHAEPMLARAHYSAHDRAAGYAQAMVSAGLSPRVIRGKQFLSHTDRVGFARQWLSQPDRPSAVVAYSSGDVLPTYMAAMELGLRVPRDLPAAVVDEHPNSILGFTFATAVIPLLEVGRTAVEQLIARIADPDRETLSIALPPTFEAGQSVLPPQ